MCRIAELFVGIAVNELLQFPVAVGTMHPRWGEVYLYSDSFFYWEINVVVCGLAVGKTFFDVGEDSVASTLEPDVDVAWCAHIGGGV